MASYEDRMAGMQAEIKKTDRAIKTIDFMTAEGLTVLEMYEVACLIKRVMERVVLREVSDAEAKATS